MSHNVRHGVRPRFRRIAAGVATLFWPPFGRSLRLPVILPGLNQLSPGRLEVPKPAKLSARAQRRNHHHPRELAVFDGVSSGS